MALQATSGEVWRQSGGACPAPAECLGWRRVAIVQASVFDAVNGIERRYAFYHVAPAAPRGASPAAAAAGAAYTALVALIPGQKPLPRTNLRSAQIT